MPADTRFQMSSLCKVCGRCACFPAQKTSTNKGKQYYVALALGTPVKLSYDSNICFWLQYLLCLKCMYIQQMSQVSVISALHQCLAMLERRTQRSSTIHKKWRILLHFPVPWISTHSSTKISIFRCSGAHLSATAKRRAHFSDGCHWLKKRIRIVEGGWRSFWGVNLCTFYWIMMLFDWKSCMWEIRNDKSLSTM